MPRFDRAALLTVAETLLTRAGMETDKAAVTAEVLVEGARRVQGVDEVSPALSVLLLHAEGRVPEQTAGRPPNPADFDIRFETTIVAGVDAAKRGLGERGPVWWNDGAPDENRRMARNSSYADWWRAAEQHGEDA